MNSCEILAMRKLLCNIHINTPNVVDYFSIILRSQIKKKSTWTNNFFAYTNRYKWCIFCNISVHFVLLEFTLQPIACVGSDVCDVSLSTWRSVQKLALGQMKDNLIKSRAMFVQNESKCRLSVMLKAGKNSYCKV